MPPFRPSATIMMPFRCQVSAWISFEQILHFLFVFIVRFNVWIIFHLFGLASSIQRLVYIQLKLDCDGSNQKLCTVSTRITSYKCDYTIQRLDGGRFSYVFFFLIILIWPTYRLCDIDKKFTRYYYFVICGVVIRPSRRHYVFFICFVLLFKICYSLFVFFIHYIYQFL